MLEWKVSVHTVEPSAYNTGILNVEKRILKIFNNLPENVKQDYGEDYGEKCKKIAL